MEPVGWFDKAVDIIKSFKLEVAANCLAAMFSGLGLIGFSLILPNQTQADLISWLGVTLIGAAVLAWIFDLIMPNIMKILPRIFDSVNTNDSGTLIPQKSHPAQVPHQPSTPDPQLPQKKAIEQD